jgi:hypothetical protein
METTPGVSERPATLGRNPSDLSLFPAGIWQSTNGESKSLASVAIGVADGDLTIGLSWVGDGGPVSWSPVRVDSLHAETAASNKAIALAATFDLGAVRCRVHANVTLGLLVLAAFNRFAPHTGLTDFAARTFFHPIESPDSEPGPAAAGRMPAAMAVPFPAVDPSPLTGTWINTNPASTGVVRYAISGRGRQVAVRPLMADGRDPGEVLADVYAKDGEPPEPMLFLASFDAGDREVEIQARLNLGLLVVVHFSRVKDAGQSNWYLREFYRRA